MRSRKLEIEIPDAIAGYLQMDDDKIKARIFRLLLADLALRRVISFGKAAELAGLDRMAFITDMGQMGIPYFDGDISDVLSDAETISRAMMGAAQ